MLNRREFMRGAVPTMAALVAGCGRRADEAPDQDVVDTVLQTGSDDATALQESEQEPQEPQDEGNHMQIRVTVNGTDFTATLDEGATGRELLARLPLTLAMDELHGNEKCCYTGTSFGGDAFVPDTIEAGDLMVFADDCLVLFYETFANGGWSYRRVGRIDDPTGLAEACGSGTAEVSFAALG